VQVSASQPNTCWNHIGSNSKRKPFDDGRVRNAINLEREVKGDFDFHTRCFIHEPTAVGQMKTAIHRKGGRSFAKYADSVLDDLLDKGGRKLSGAKCRELVRQAQMRVLENYTFIGTAYNMCRYCAGR
jgi:hypothetical protein